VGEEDVRCFAAPLFYVCFGEAFVARRPLCLPSAALKHKPVHRPAVPRRVPVLDNAVVVRRKWSMVVFLERKGKRACLKKL